MDFKKMLKERKSIIENELERHMKFEKGYQNTVFEAMKYSVDAGGKRLRPILLIEACEMLGGKREDAMPFACAVEMIHTYSLIHDDLPAMDDDDLRRGKPTNHKVFGEGMAVLAGDGLLNHAFETMIKKSLEDEKRAHIYIKAMNEIANGSGVHGMIGGQVVDLESENKQIDIDTLDYIHMNKTAKMIIKPMRAGAIIASASESDMEAVTKYANAIGLAFQIVDDILDIEGDQEKLGKDIGSDIENQKSTYPSILGLEESKKIAKRLIEEGKEAIKSLNVKDEFLIELADYILNRDC